MSKEKKDAKSGDSHGQLLIFGIILLLALLMKAWPKICYFWEIHKTTILSLLLLGGLSLLVLAGVKLWNWFANRSQEKSITEEDDSSVFLGVDAENSQMIHLKQPFRTMHTQVIGTTNAGKTESVILPWAISDIKKKSGLLIIDGKSDASFVRKLYSYVKFYGREDDFRLFSLANPGPSSSFNPLNGESPQQVAERVFSSFTFENEFYKNLQYRVFLSIIRLIFAQKEIPTFALVQRLLVDVEELTKWIAACPDEMLKRDMTRFTKIPEKDREEKISGLETMLSHFTSSEVGELFADTDHAIDFDEALAKSQIIYFQLPTMYFPFMASATGKLVLQCFQNAVSKRQIYLGDEEDGKSEVLFVHP